MPPEIRILCHHNCLYFCSGYAEGGIGRWRSRLKREGGRPDSSVVYLIPYYAIVINFVPHQPVHTDSVAHCAPVRNSIHTIS